MREVNALRGVAPLAKLIMIDSANPNFEVIGNAFVRRSMIDATTDFGRSIDQQPSFRFPKSETMMIKGGQVVVVRPSELGLLAPGARLDGARAHLLEQVL